MNGKILRTMCMKRQPDSSQTAQPPGLQSAACRQAREHRLTSDCDVGDPGSPECPLVANSLG